MMKEYLLIKRNYSTWNVETLLESDSLEEILRKAFEHYETDEPNSMRMGGSFDVPVEIQPAKYDDGSLGVYIHIESEDGLEKLEVLTRTRRIENERYFQQLKAEGKL